VWDYLSAKDRERLQNMKTTAEKPPPPMPAIVEVPRTEPAVAKAALMGFQPFQQDPVKQARYTAYLHLQAGANQTLPPQLQPLANQTIEEFNVELQSFAKAAQIFKPMSMAMASRFKSSTLNEGLLDVVQEGLYQPPASAYQEKGKETEMEEKRVAVEESPKEHAARMGMFGKLTREEAPWLPAKLLCKRFGVKVPEVVLDDPANQMDIDERPTATPLPGGGEGLLIPSHDQDISAGNTEPVRAIAASDGASLAKMSKGRRDLNNIGLGEDDDQGNDILTYERPTMDIFKAIFASDEEDSGVSDDEDKPDKPTVAKGEAPQSSKLASAFAPKLPPINTSASGDAPQSKEQDTTMDLSSFRPTFISKSEREGAKVKSSKPDKTKKKATKALVSFGVDEDEGGGLTVIPSMKKRKREKEKEKREDEKGKKKKKEKEREKNSTVNIDMDDDDMWVEKPVNLPVDADKQTNAGSVQTLNSSRRPKAADFL
jgi:G patch domain-containing protein 1